MTYKAISGDLIQRFVDNAAANGYYIKGYRAGTSTSLPMGIDAIPTSTLVKAQINQQGYAVNGSNAPFIPHFNRDYKLSLYATESDADGDVNAVTVIDGIKISDSDDGWKIRSDTATRLTTTTFQLSVADGDAASDYHVGRRIRFNGTAYGTISYSDFNSAVSNATHVTVVMDSGDVPSSITSLALGLITAVDSSMPVGFFPLEASESGVVDFRYQRGDVRRYGAKGDDATDDVAALQAALNSGASVVSIPESYVCYSSATLTMADDQTITGGKIKFYGTYATETNMLVLRSRCCVKSIVLEAGTRATATGITDSKYGGDTSYNFMENTTAIGRPAGVDISDVELRNVTMKYFGRGYNISSESSTIVTKNIKIINCDVMQCGEYFGTLFKVKNVKIEGGYYWHGGTNGITLPSAQDVHISNIKMWNPAGTGINPGGSSTSSLEAKDITVVSNHVVARDPFTCENGGKRIHVSSNHFYPFSITGADGFGINVACDQTGNGQNIENISIVANTIYGGLSDADYSGSKASGGIRVRIASSVTSTYAVDGVTISGNTINDIDDDAITILGQSTVDAVNVSITGNSGSGIGRRAVSIENVSDFSVSGNDFERAAIGVATDDKDAYYFTDVENGQITGNRSKNFNDHMTFIGDITGTVRCVVMLSYDNSYSGGEFILYAGETGFKVLDLTGLTSGGVLLELHGAVTQGSDIDSGANLIVGSKVYKRDSALTAGGYAGEILLSGSTWKGFGVIQT